MDEGTSMSKLDNSKQQLTSNPQQSSDAEIRSGLAGLLHRAQNNNAQAAEKPHLVCGQQHFGLQRLLCVP